MALSPWRPIILTFDPPCSLSPWQHITLAKYRSNSIWPWHNMYLRDTLLVWCPITLLIYQWSFYYPDTASPWLTIKPTPVTLMFSDDTLSPRHHIILTSYHPDKLSSWHFIALTRYRPDNLSPRHPFTLTSCHPIILALWNTQKIVFDCLDAGYT